MVFETCVMETQQSQSKQCSDVYETFSRTEKTSTEASVMWRAFYTQEMVRCNVTKTPAQRRFNKWLCFPRTWWGLFSLILESHGRKQTTDVEKKSFTCWCFFLFSLKMCLVCYTTLCTARYSQRLAHSSIQLRFSAPSIELSAQSKSLTLAKSGW